jgi:hypothetical protein
VRWGTGCGVGYRRSPRLARKCQCARRYRRLAAAAAKLFAETDFARALATPTNADATFERSRRLPAADLGRPPIREVKFVDDRAQARRRQDIVDHDHVATVPPTL